MPLTLLNIPGFADVPNSALAAENPASGLNLNRISLNAAFGMVRPEVFYGIYKNGETVPVPSSAVDGYTYDRSELIYCWAVQSTLNPESGWITGPDSLWFGEWNVNQTNGAVESFEWYRRSGSHDNAAQSNDGALAVFTVAQRRKTSLLLSSEINSFTDIADGDFVTDAALTQSMAQNLNNDAKFAVLNSEVIYMGEFTNGQTVPQPESPADGYTYSYSQVKFTFSWRWTTLGSSFTQPNKSLGQLGPMMASINGANGAVSVSVAYIPDENTVSTQTTHGRIAVFAFCSRNNLLGTFGAVADDFAEIDSEVFMPGETLRASTALQLMKNIREAACSSEFFGPTSYETGDTVPLPTSPVDGYTYTRAECTYIWEWEDTTNETGDHLRVAAFWGNISQSTGVVTLRNWRLPPGGPYDESNTFSSIRVLVVASRGAQHTAVTVPAGNEPGDSGSTTVDNNPPDIAPYAIPLDMGEGISPTSNQSILKHIISGDVAGVTLASGLPTSEIKARIASTGTYAIDIKLQGVSIGTITFSSGNATASLTFAGTIVASPLDELELIAPGSLDSTLSGIYGTISGRRS